MTCSGYCKTAGETLARKSQEHRAILWAVLFINVIIFLGEYGAGWFAHSAALQGDSLDSLGDALVYGLSLAVVGGSLQARAASALTKGGIQLVFASGVLAEVFHKLIAGIAPIPSIMVFAASGALIGNVACLLLLTRFRWDDVNMRSVWLCSRNDVIGNIGVLVTTGLIALTGWGWLDLLFGAGLALLFLHTGFGVVRDSWSQLRQHPATVWRDGL